MGLKAKLAPACYAASGEHAVYSHSTEQSTTHTGARAHTGCFSCFLGCFSRVFPVSKIVTFPPPRGESQFWFLDTPQWSRPAKMLDNVAFINVQFVPPLDRLAN